MARRLAAILAADVVGYSRLIREDEANTLAALKADRAELIAPKLAQYHGRIVKLMGDGLLAEFPSAVEAVRCSVEIQHVMGERAAAAPPNRRITYRVGVNIGDVVVDGDDIYGDGVNVAARLEGLAEPGGVCVSRNVFDQVKDKLDLTFEHGGEKAVKNIAEPVTIYRVVLDDKAAKLVTAMERPSPAKGTRRWRQMAAAFLLTAVGFAGLVWWRPGAPDVEPASVEAMAFPLPDKPSLAVLPFDNLSEEASQDYFADGMTEDLITDLANISGLFVIARNSSFSYKDQQVQVRQVAEELGVRYVLEGSVRRAGDVVRINAQLIDATTGGHLWADRYDGMVDDVFALQDRVLREIVRALSVRLTKSDEYKLDQRRQPVNLAAYEWLLKGRQELAEQDHQKAAMARIFFEKAIKAEPGYARAYTNLGFYYWNEWRLWGRNKKNNLEKGQEFGHRAFELDNSSAAAAVLLAVTYQYQGKHANAGVWADKAMELEPAQAETLANLGGYFRHANRYGEAVEILLKAIRLDPMHPPHWLSWLGHAYLMDGKPKQAISVLTDAIAQAPNYIANHVYLTATYASLGQPKRAADAAKQVMRLNEKFTVSAFERHMSSITQDPAPELLISRALRAAGVPE